MSIREELRATLRRLRGPYTTTQVGRALGRSRQAVTNMESGDVSITRLEWLEDFYDVDFLVVARDRRTGRFWFGEAAPGLVRRIEGDEPPMLMPSEGKGHKGRLQLRPVPEPAPAPQAVGVADSNTPSQPAGESTPRAG